MESARASPAVYPVDLDRQTNDLRRQPLALATAAGYACSREGSTRDRNALQRALPARATHGLLQIITLLKILLSLYFTARVALIQDVQRLAGGLPRVIRHRGQ